MNFTLIICSILIAYGSFMVSAQAKELPEEKKTLIFAVSNYLTPASVKAEYQPLIDHLNQSLKQIQVELRVFEINDFDDALRNQQVDFATTNPTHYVQLRAAHQLSGPIATLLRNHKGVHFSQLGGVIVTKANRNDINQLEDLVGKRIAITGTQRLGGYWAQLYTLHLAGIDLNEHKSFVVGNGDHVNTLEMLMRNQADVAFLRTGVLERLQTSGSLALKDFKVINARIMPGFPHLISTELFPEWPIFVTPRLNEENMRELLSALYAFQGEGRLYGYTSPESYLVVEKLAQQLRLPPYDHLPTFTLNDVWHKWTPTLIVIVSLLILLIALTSALALVLKRARHDRQRLSLLMSSLGEGVIGVSKAGQCTFVNERALELIGRSQKEMIGCHVANLFDQQVQPKLRLLADKNLKQGLDAGELIRFESQLTNAEGQQIPVQLTISPLIEYGELTGAEMIVQDLSEQKEADRRLFTLANFDDMTQFANRRYFMEQLQKQLRLGHKVLQSQSLLMLDIDHFKTINDTYGHAAGDKALITFAELVCTQLPLDAHVGRMGGEEFAILLPEPIQTAKVWAENLRQDVANIELNYEGQRFHFTVSIGIASIHPQDLSIDRWLARADQYLYLAKTSGRNRIEGDAS